MSQLSEVQPNSLQLLMNKEPSTLTDAEVEQIVQILREQRKNFAEAVPKGVKKTSAAADLSLDDLGL